MLVRHDVAPSLYVVDPRSWPSIARIFGAHGGGVAIAPTWVLTAAHVARLVEVGQPMALGDDTLIVAERHLHPTVGGHRPGVGVDLALLRVASPACARPMPLGTVPEVAEMVTMVGSGDTGDGLSGTQSTDGALRRCTSRVSSVGRQLFDVTFRPPASATDLEGASGVGDSGGPALRSVQGMWHVVGINSFQISSTDGRYGARTCFQRVDPHRDWIARVVGA